MHEVRANDYVVTMQTAAATSTVASAMGTAGKTMASMGKARDPVPFSVI